MAPPNSCPLLRTDRTMHSYLVPRPGRWSTEGKQSRREDVALTSMSSRVESVRELRLRILLYHMGIQGPGGRLGHIASARPPDSHLGHVPSLGKVDTSCCRSLQSVFRLQLFVKPSLQLVSVQARLPQHLSQFSPKPGYAAAWALNVAVECAALSVASFPCFSPNGVRFSFRGVSLLHPPPWNLDGIASHPPCNISPVPG